MDWSGDEDRFPKQIQPSGGVGSSVNDEMGAIKCYIIAVHPKRDIRSEIGDLPSLNIQSSGSLERTTNYRVYGGKGIDRAVFFPVTYGGGYTCPLDVQIDQIIIVDKIVCLGDDGITLRADSIEIQDSAGLETENGDITLTYNDPATPSQCTMINARIYTLADLTINLSLVTSNFSSLTALTTNIKYASAATSVSSVILDQTNITSDQIMIKGKCLVGIASSKKQLRCAC